ncbi:unnamed protein product [Adineta steineri]|uniref:Band 7 domain-containing protein n=2 Tax=Adineta steineri TaxID=433720 RepID=A0A815EG21_9BILA|nr:unnamed protein product [Adineta steineri]
MAFVLNRTLGPIVSRRLLQRAITNATSEQQYRFRSRLPFNTVVLFVPQQEAWVVERMGKFYKTLTPGLNILLPVIDNIRYVQSLKEIAIEIPSQTAISKDNVTLSIDGVLYLKVFDPYLASYGVEDAEFAVTQLAQTTMRSEIGKISLDTLFRERELLNTGIVEAINKAAKAWGIDCLRYEIRDIRLPPKVQEAMQMQVEAERRKRATILESEGVREAQINKAEVVLFVPQQEAWVVERMGKFYKTLTPGLNILLAVIDNIRYVQSLKEIAIEIPSQTAISKDNVTLSIDGVLYLKVFDPYLASYGVEDAEFAVTQLAQTTMRSEIGKISLDTLFRERELLNTGIVEAINKAAKAWGIDCLRYEIRDIRLPPKVQEAMQMQVEAERRKRATILESEGVREAQINKAEGTKRATVLASEGFKLEQINNATGEAEAIRARANARAEALQTVSNQLRIIFSLVKEIYYHSANKNDVFLTVKMCVFSDLSLTSFQLFAVGVKLLLFIHRLLIFLAL